MLNNLELKIENLNNFSMNFYLSNSEEKFSAKSFTPHVHDILEIYVLIDGDVNFMVENNIYKLSPGDALITKPNELHHCILNSTSIHKHFCFWFNPESDFIFGDFLSHPSGQDNIIKASDSEKMLETCFKIYNAKISGDDFSAFNQVINMFSLLKSDIKNKVKRLYIPENLQNVLNDINANFKEINSVEYICKKHFISHSSLCRLFNFYLSTTPKVYLETKRLAYARILLLDGCSVLDASMKAGFPDYSNFIRLFKERFNQTPNQYRKNNS